MVRGSRLRCRCFFPSRRRHTRFDCDWSSDVCSSDLPPWRPGRWSMAYPSPSEAVFMLHYVPRYMVKRASELSQRGYRYADGPTCILEAAMKVSVIRVIATLLLSGQMLPVGLPLLCDQVQRGTSATCEQRMASVPSGAAVE